MKRLLVMLLALMIPFGALAESLPLGGPAPYAPVTSALSEDGLSYDDGTMTVRVEQDIAYDTKITYVYVTITDPSQLRTALAAKFPSKQRQPVASMAEKNNAVLAINGDFFTYHTQGIAVRGGEMLRNAPHRGRDTLIIDDKGDFTILTNTTRDNFAAFDGVVREAFCFGPGLIVDGVKQEYKYKEKTSCGYPTPAQRLAICQLDTLSYLIVATEGPEQDKKAGLTIPEFTELLLAKNVKHAYNLDGGSSTTIILCGKRINAPESKPRNVGDIIYFATLAQ